MTEPSAASMRQRPLSGTADVLLLFRGVPPRPRVSAGYRLGVLAAAFAVVLLPLAYLALIAGIGWLLVLHASASRELLAAHDPGHVRAVAYFGPIVGGVIAIFFLLKPFVAPRVKLATAPGLTRDRQPLLWCFVDELTRLAGTPAAARIVVDTDANAAAELLDGWRGLLRRRLVLRVGMPVLRGLTIRELGVVLGHEVGHFAQGSGLLLVWVVRSINGWLFRVVHERDEWDTWLLEKARELDARYALALHLTRGLVWLSRRVLWVLMVLGALVSAAVMRQMELDADRRAASIGGSTGHGLALRRMDQLALGRTRALRVLADSWRDRRLCADVPGLAVRLADDPPNEPAPDATSDRVAALFADHPPAAVRTAAVAKLGQHGVLFDERPAEQMVIDAAALSVEVSTSFFLHELRIEPSVATVRPLEVYLAELHAARDENRRAQELGLDLFSPVRPLGLASMDRAAAELDDSREVLRAAQLRMRSWMAELGAARRSGRTPTQSELRRHSDATRDVLSTAIGMLPALRPHLSTAEARHREAGELIAALAAVEAGAGAMQALCDAHASTAALREQAQLDVEHGGERMTRHFAHLAAAASEALGPLQHVPYPFEHASGTLSLATYATLGPATSDVSRIIDRLFAFHSRALARLAAIAAEAEQAAASSSNVRQE